MRAAETFVFDSGGATADRYTVIIAAPFDADAPFHFTFDRWYMSDDALMPNGVCMYGGNINERELSEYFEDSLPLKVWPPQVKTQIERLLAQTWCDDLR